VVEAMVEPAGLPTRTEIDEVHRSLYELKRRLRLLEKASARAAAEPEQPPAGAAKPAREASARKPAARKPAARRPARRKSGETK
jgi:hypothetical protein